MARKLIILGLNAYHADASACLVRDGTVVAAIAEERLGPRRKHYAGFPAHAIRKVLETSGTHIREVDVVAVGHNPSANLGPKLGYALLNPVRASRAARTSLGRQRRTRALANVLAEECGFQSCDCEFHVVNVEHHLAHLASAYYCSDFSEAAGFSFDASGDFVSVMYASCGARAIDVAKRIYLPHSLGYFYTALSQFIGFDRYGEEYKVMGLAAYGRPAYRALMEEVLTPGLAGEFVVNPRYFSGLLTQAHLELVDEHGEIIVPPLYSEALVEQLGMPRRRGSEITRRDMDIAASCQAHFEAVTIHCLRWLHDQVPADSLVVAGGCALNGVCNGRILRDTSFKRTYTQCAAGDDGTALGAALHVWNTVAEHPRSPPLWSAALGPEYTAEEIEIELSRMTLPYSRLSRDQLLEAVSDCLAAGGVVGWYQGRSEWGPRALGQRSILAHPGWPGMKDTINTKIKRREPFRPFAPSILADRVDDYFEESVTSPFMMHVVRIRESRRGELAAVTHVDFTGRLHTVSRADNRLYYDLIQRFCRKTGTPVLLNTSFNENEPIVETPGQALNCFLRSDMDLLCMGPFVVFREARTG